jgi:hypothetical protein
MTLFDCEALEDVVCSDVGLLTVLMNVKVLADFVELEDEVAECLVIVCLCADVLAQRVALQRRLLLECVRVVCDRRGNVAARPIKNAAKILAAHLDRQLIFDCDSASVSVHACNVIWKEIFSMMRSVCVSVCIASHRCM